MDNDHDDLFTKRRTISDPFLVFRVERRKEMTRNRKEVTAVITSNREIWTKAYYFDKKCVFFVVV